jgi:TRAP-type C4-dicarboxylate transport system substrate-binding protein
MNSFRCFFVMLTLLKKPFTLFFIGFVLLYTAAAVKPSYGGSPQYIFKVASLAPEGSVWAKRFRDFANEVTEKSGGEIYFKIYAGGVMGDDRAMHRKMRIGQLNGGGADGLPPGSGLASRPWCAGWRDRARGAISNRTSAGATCARTGSMPMHS